MEALSYLKLTSARLPLVTFGKFLGKTWFDGVDQREFLRL
jgi:hypothetical protein